MMPLDLDDMEKAAAAELEEISFGLITAIRNQNDAEFDRLMENLRNFEGDITVPKPFRDAASNLLQDAAIDMVASAVAQLGAVVDNLAQAGSGLKSAISIGETGKAELFFPAIAAATQRAVSVLEEFKKTADKLADANPDIQSLVGDLQESWDKLNILKTNIENIRSTR